MLYVNTCKIDKLLKNLCNYDLFNLNYPCNDDHEQLSFQSSICV